MPFVPKPIAHNRKAYYNYEVIDKYEAGLVLVSSEVKSICGGRSSFNDAYADIRSDGVYLVNFHISGYNESRDSHAPLRERKLLLHKSEIRKLDEKVKTKGMTLVPLDLHLSESGKIKVLLGLCKGKHSYDKKQSIKERDLKIDQRKETK